MKVVLYAEDRTVLVAYLIFKMLIAALVSSNETVIFVIILVAILFLQSPKYGNLILCNPLFGLILNYFSEQT